MRSFRAPVAFICLSLIGHGLLGQVPPPPLQAPSPYPTAAAVLMNQADVYSGPSTAYYPTSRLKYGDRIVVLGESKKQPGWLEIVPPPGSFSWIDAKFVKVVPGMDKIGIVDTGDSKGTAPIMPGGLDATKPPNVEITRVATGTQLLLLDRPTVVCGTSLYAIAPVATEVRFVPLDAVRNGGSYASTTPGYGTQTIPAGWQNSVGQAAGASGSWQPAAPAANPNAFIDNAKQGDQSLAAGYADRARLFYIEALGQTTDPTWRNYLTGQLARIQGAGAAGQAPFQTASSPAGIRPAAELPVSPPPAAPAAPAAKQWSPWGVLRTTTFTSREGQPMYMLEDHKNGSPLMYVTTQQGTSLREYIGQIIIVYGAVVTRNDANINMQLIVAERFSTPPAAAK